MGEGQGQASDAGGWLFEPEFNRAIKLRQADPRITSNAGAFLLREADHRLGLTADLAAQLTDPRRPDRIRYLQVELLRQHLYALALGYVHQDDQDLLAHDPALKLSVWDRPGRQGLYERLASQPTDYRLLDRLAAPGIEQRDGWALVEHYRRRGTFEDRLGEFNGAIGNGLSAGSFAANEASLLLKRLAFNLAGMLRGELEDASGCGWDLKRVQQTVLKAGARLVQHARRVIVDVAQAAGVLWDRLLDRIQRWWQPSLSATGPRGAPRRWGRSPPRPRRWVRLAGRQIRPSGRCRFACR